MKHAPRTCAAPARDPGLVGRRTQGLAHHDLERLQQAGPVVGRTPRARSGNGEAVGVSGPDPVARSLRTRHAGAVGLIITEPLNYSFRDPAALDFVAGLAESCEAAGQGLLLVAVGPNRSVSDGTAAVLAAGVDGFVVYSASDDDRTWPWCSSAICRWSSF